HKKAQENIQKALSGNPSKNIEYRALRKDGSTFPVFIYSSPIFSEEESVGLRGIIIDISERKQAEEALLESEERFRQIVEQSNDVFYRQNINTAKFEYVSPHVQDVLGYTPKEMLILSLEEQKEQIHPDDLPNLINFSKELVEADKRGERHNEREFRIKRKSGEFIWIRGSYNLTRDEEGEPHLIVGSLQDITERKQAEDAVRESEARFRNLMDFVPGVSVQGYDSEGIVSYWNKASEGVYGFTAEEALGQNLGDLIIPDDVMPLYEKGLEIGKDVERSGEFAPPGEVELLHKKGHLVPVYSIHTVVKLPGKDPILFCIDVDLSERNKKGEALKASEQRLKDIFEGTGDGLIYSDKKGKVLEVNDLFSKMMNIPREDLIGKNGIFLAKKFLTASSLPDIAKIIKDNLKGNRTHNFELEFNNRMFELKTRTAAERKGITATIRDITERKRAEEELKESEAKYREIATSIPGVVYQFTIKKDGSYAFPYVDESCETFFQHKARAVESDPNLIFNMVPPDELQSFKDSIEESARTLTEWRHDFRVVLPDGQERWFEGRSVPHLLPSGEPLWNGVVTDVTEHKRAEVSLRESEEKFKLISEQSLMGIVIIQEYKLKYCNDAASSIFEYSIEKMLSGNIGEMIKERIYSDDQSFVLEQLKKKQRGDTEGIEKQYSYRLVTNSGKVKWVDQYSKTILYQGKPADLVTLIEITERKVTEQALRESETKYRLLAENAVDFIFQMDLKLKFTYMSPSLYNVMGYYPEDVVGTRLFQYAPRKEFFKIARIAISTLKNFKKDPTALFETKLYNKRREEIPVEISGKVLLDKKGKPIALQGNVRDITERVRARVEREKAEKALLASEKKYRTLVDNAFDAIYLLRNRNYEYVNPRFCEITGYSFNELTDPEFDFNILYNDKTKAVVERRFHARKKGEEIENQFQVQIISKSRKIVDVDVSTVPIGAPGEVAVLGIMRDISERKQAEIERKKLEERFAEAQKKESLSVLAGGIAHDFNNLLVGILGNASLALMDMSPLSPARESLEEIEKSAQRAADLTRQMLAYSGKGQFIIEDFDLSELVTEMIHLMRASISKKAQLKTSFDRQLPGIKGDLTQIRQLTMNLLINASEALDDKVGIIKLITGIKTCSRELLKKTYLGEKLPPGDYVFLEISDTGSGMNDDTLKKIFDPFFTTKFTGRGLGLAASLGIIEGHHGTFKITSGLGKGTTFTVYFPASDTSVKKIPPKTETGEITKGSGTILVADDEPVVLSLGKRTLERAGYKILTATDGLECVEVFEKNANDISLVLLDLLMPHLNGEEAFKKLKRIKSNVKVILSSGFSEEEARERFAGKGLAGFIHKPYNPLQLIDMVNEILK
ncbi:PAS domain S-box protein, partial [Calditrichota bacterium]